MNPVELLRVALQALRANKARGFLTMLGVIIGVAAVILLVSIGSGLRSFITQRLEELGSNLILVLPGKIDLDKISPAGGGGAAARASFMTSKLKREDAAKFSREIPQIKNAVAVIMASGTIKFKGKEAISEVIGTTENYNQVRNFSLAEGEFFSKTDVSSGRKVAVLGHKVAEDLFGELDPIGRRIKIEDTRYAVIGVLEEKGAYGSTIIDERVIVPITCVERQFDKENVNLLYVEATAADEVPKVIPQVEKVLKKRLDEDDFSVIDQKEILSTVSSILGVLTVALGGIAAISLLVGGIGIMNIMLVSVTERTREIGLRKALGATPRVIMLQFLIEAVCLSVGGGLIGILLGATGSLALNRFMPTSVTPWSVVVAFLVSSTIGVVFGVGPATKAARLNPIDALRYE